MDITGATIQVPVQPQRIVALHDINAGVQVLSLGGPLAGITARTDGAAEPVARYFDLRDVVDVGITYEPDLEAIVALQPDLIIGEATTTRWTSAETRCWSNCARSLRLWASTPSVRSRR